MPTDDTQCSGGTERSLWCRLFGHNWHVSVIRILVPTNTKYNVYKSERCRRCKQLRKRSDEPVGERSLHAGTEQSEGPQ